MSNGLLEPAGLANDECANIFHAVLFNETISAQGQRFFPGGGDEYQILLGNNASTLH